MDNYTTIGKAFKLKSGKQLSASIMKEGIYPVFGGNGINGYHNEYTFEESKILIGRVGAYCGNVHLSQANSWITDNTLYIDKKLFDYDDNYLVYLLRSLNFNQYASQSGQPLISVGRIKDVKIPLPPLPQQQKIANILDAADALKQKDKALLAKYDELTQALFLDMFGDPVSNPKGWEKKPFEYFAKFDTKMTSDFSKYSELPHVGIANIEKNTGRILNCSKVKHENLSSGKYIFTNRHIIYSKIRPNLNKVALPDFDGLCSADSYPLLVDNKNSNRMFFSYLLRSESFLEFILQHSTRTNIPKANKAQMKLYYGIAPQVTLQNQFAERVQIIEQQKAIAKKSLEKSEELFNSLLQKAFKGELV